MTTTTLAPVDQAYIEEVVRKAIANMMNSVSSRDRYEMELRERVIRVEEGLKHQSELMQTGFALMEKRMDQTDKRLELMQQETNRRFEQMQQEMNRRFEQMQQEMLKGFDQQHREIIALHNDMKVQMRWGFGILLTTAGLVIAIIKML